MENKKIVLNNKEIENLPFAENGKEYEVTDKDFTCLHLRVTKNVKSFRFEKKYKILGMIRITIGSYPEIKRKNAVDKCVEYMDMITKGLDPRKEIKSQKNEYTLKDAFDFYLEKNKDEISATVYKAYQVDVPKFFDKFMNKKLSFITDEEVEDIFDSITENNGPSAANHAIQKLKAIINFAKKKHKYSGDNPCDPIDLNLKHDRSRFLNETEFPIFMDAVEKEDLLMRSIFKILLFTGVRKTNVLEMRWSQIDFCTCIWSIDKTKNGDPLDVYLCDQAIKVLNSLPRFDGCDWVFVNPKTMDRVKDIKKAFKRILKRCGIKNLVIHDLRRSFATVLLSSGVEPSVVAKILGHKSLLATNVYAKLLDYVKKAATQKAVDNIDKMVGNTHKINVVESEVSQNTYQMSYNISTSIASNVGLFIK